MKVAQLWQEYEGKEEPVSNKFYSKIGTAYNLAKKRNEWCSFHTFVKVYELTEIGTIRE